MPTFAEVAESLERADEKAARRLAALEALEQVVRDVLYMLWPWSAKEQLERALHALDAVSGEEA